MIKAERKSIKAEHGIIANVASQDIPCIFVAMALMGIKEKQTKELKWRDCILKNKNINTVNLSKESVNFSAIPYVIINDEVHYFESANTSIICYKYPIYDGSCIKIFDRKSCQQHIINKYLKPITINSTRIFNETYANAKTIKDEYRSLITEWLYHDDELLKMFRSKGLKVSYECNNNIIDINKAWKLFINDDIESSFLHSVESPIFTIIDDKIYYFKIKNDKINHKGNVKFYHWINPDCSELLSDVYIPIRETCCKENETKMQSDSDGNNDNNSIDSKNGKSRISKVDYYLSIAETVSKRGTCLRRKFGAIIVNNDRIVSTGYVGAPRGRVNCCDRGKCIRMENNIPSGQRYELCRSVHAEANAIINASIEEMDQATLYLIGIENDGSVTNNAEPCSMCKRLIINSGIKNVITKTNNGIKIFNVDDWIRNDDSLDANHQGY